MKSFFTLLILAAFAVVTTGIQSAEAKRFGGGMSFGKSFGSKQRAAPPRNIGQQKAVPSKQASQRGSARTGMMGAVAGLALGGLLGAMFFGGAFEGLNFFDILMFAGVAWLLFTLFKRKASSMNYQRQGASEPFFDFDNTSHADIQGHAVKPDIDETFFLKVSKDIFIRMQAAWDLANMDEIRSFCTPEVAAQIEENIQAEKHRKNNTEVATLDAVISDTWVESDLEWAAVHFTAMLKEESLSDGVIEEDQRHEVQEHWIFQHDPTSDDPTWYLAGIQQN